MTDVQKLITEARTPRGAFAQANLNAHSYTAEKSGRMTAMSQKFVWRG